MHASAVMQMLFHSAPLLIVILVDMAALLAYNYSGMCVTGAFSASLDKAHHMLTALVHQQSHALAARDTL